MDLEPSEYDEQMAHAKNHRHRPPDHHFSSLPYSHASQGFQNSHLSIHKRKEWLSNIEEFPDYDAFKKDNNPLPQDTAKHLRRGIDLSRLKDRMAELQTIQECLDTFISSNEHLLSSSRMLPAEVLNEIFSHYESRSNGRPFTIGPVVLTQVCRLWRASAMSWRPLWAHIFVRIHGSKDLVKNAGALLDEALKRSLHHPLEIVFLTAGNNFTTLVSETMALLAMLVVHADRWQKIHITIPTAHIPILNHVRGRLNLLTSCSIGVYGDIHTPMNALELAPRLDTIDVQSPAFPSSIALPWSQITELITDEWSTDQIPTVLTKLPQLEVLVLGLDCQAPSDRDLISTALTHSRLRKLTIFDAYSILAFSHMKLPALRELKFFALGHDSFHAIQTFFFSTDANIETLDLGLVILPDEHRYCFRATLHSALSIVDLRLSFGGPDLTFDDSTLLHLIEMLTLSPNTTADTQILPSLAQLDIFCAVQAQRRILSLDSRVYDMLLSRINADGSWKLKGAKIEFGADRGKHLTFPNLTRTTRGQLRYMKKMGMDLSVVWKSRVGSDPSDDDFGVQNVVI